MIRTLTGDCRTLLPTLPAGSVDCVVTSPPYFGLRDYGVADQIGIEASPDAYVAELVAVFREVRRVLKDDGTCWLNLGDSYGRGARVDNVNDNKRGASSNTGHVSITAAEAYGRGPRSHLAAKNLLMIPARVALALQADGWWLRSHIIWSKPNPMPESVTDRPTSAHESVFLLTKRERYYYDAEAVREPVNPNNDGRLRAPKMDGYSGERMINGARQQAERVYAEIKGANLRNVWTIASAPFAEAHFATFPPALAERCIKAGCRVGGVVLDPFGGAGTVGLVADRLGRDATLIDLNPAYVAMARDRITGDAPLFVRVEEA